MQLHTLSADDLKAFNSPGTPDAVAPFAGTATATAAGATILLPAQSFVVAVAKLA